MENNLKLSIGMTADTQQVDQAINRLKQQIKDLQAPSNQLSHLSVQQQQHYSQAQEIVKKRAVQDLTKEYQILQMQFDKNKKTLEGMNEESDEAVKIARENIALGKEINDLKSREAQLTGDTAKEMDKQNTKASQFLATLGKIVATGALIKGALNTAAFVNQLPMQTTMNQGAINQMAMEPMQLARQGRGYETLAFGKERAEAMQMAGEKRDTTELLDRIGAIVGIAGAATIGGGMGGIAGAITGGASAMMNNQRGMLSLGSLVGLGDEAYKSLGDREQMQDYQALTQAKRYENLNKGLGSDFLNENMGSMLQMSRATGLSDEELYGRGRVRTQRGMAGEMGGSYLEQGMIKQITGDGDNIRFSPSEAMKMLTSLSLSGVSNDQLSESGGSLGRTALSAQQEGVRGAAGVMGRFGSIGAAQSDEQFIRLFARGLDSSRTGEDLNRFMQVTADLALKSGFVDEEMQNRILAGTKDNTQFALDMSAKAAMAYEERAGSTSGLEGQVGMQFLTSRKNIESVFGGDKGSVINAALQSDTTLASEINQLTSADAADTQLMQSYAERIGNGATAEDVKKLINSKGSQKVRARVEANPELKKAYEDFLEQSSEEFSRTGKMPDKPSGGSYSRLKGTGGMYGFGGEEGMALFRQLRADDLGQEFDPNTENARNVLDSKEGGVAGAVKRSQAVGESAMFEGFTEFRQQFETQANAVNTSLAAATMGMDALNAAAEKSAKGLSLFSDIMLKMFENYNSQVPLNQRIDTSVFTKPSSPSASGGGNRPSSGMGGRGI